MRPNKIQLCNSILLGLIFMVSASAQPYAYVASAGSITVTVVDRSNDSIAGFIVAPQPTVGVDVSPDDSKIYIAHTGGLAIADAATRSVLANIDLPSSPQNVAVSPNGRWAYVTMPWINQVAVIDTSAQSIIDTLNIPGCPWMVVFDRYSYRAYVTSMYAGTLSIIRVSDRTVARTVQTGAGASALDISPNGARIYVANSWDNTVTVHAYNGVLLDTIQGFSYPTSIAVSPLNDRFYVVNGGSQSVAILRTATHEFINTVQVGMSPVSVAATAERAYVANEYSFSMSVVGAAQSALVDTLDWVGYYPVSVALSKH